MKVSDDDNMNNSEKFMRKVNYKSPSLKLRNNYNNNNNNNNNMR